MTAMTRKPIDFVRVGHRSLQELMDYAAHYGMSAQAYFEDMLNGIESGEAADRDLEKPDYPTVEGARAEDLPFYGVL
jgi:hypothetical protein